MRLLMLFLKIVLRTLQLVRHHAFGDLFLQFFDHLDYLLLSISSMSASKALNPQSLPHYLTTQRMLTSTRQIKNPTQNCSSTNKTSTNPQINTMAPDSDSDQDAITKEEISGTATLGGVSRNGPSKPQERNACK